MTAPNVSLTDDQSRTLLIDIYLRGLEHGAGSMAGLLNHCRGVTSPVPPSVLAHDLMHAAADDPLVRETIEGNIRQVVARAASAIKGEG